MITYITAFIFYTLAMVGILIGGFIVYKKTIAPIRNENKGMIQVVDSYAVAPKKSLMVVKVKQESFLIALDSERTTFLTKLDENKKISATVEKALPNEAYDDLESDVQQEIQQMLKEKANRYDDVRKAKNDELQKQFMQLYAKDEPEVHNMQNDEISRRKQMIRHLISELNNDKTAGSKF